jgi:hypothetical protein
VRPLGPVSRRRAEKLFALTDEITADCPRKLAKNSGDPCDAKCPDLPKVL